MSYYIKEPGYIFFTESTSTVKPSGVFEQRQQLLGATIHVPKNRDSPILVSVVNNVIVNDNYLFIKILLMCYFK